MSFVFDDTSSVMHLATTSLVSGYSTSTSSTLFAWFKKPTVKQTGLVSAYSFGSIPGDIQKIYLEQTGGDFAHGRGEPYSGSGSDQVTANAYSSNTWTPVVTSATLGGAVTIKMGSGSEVSGGTMSSSWLHAAFSRVMIGQDPQSSYTGTGQTVRIAHVALWKVALSFADRASLNNGANPLAINASNLVEYWSGASLTGYNGTVLSWSGGTGTVNDSDNPTVDAPPGGAGTVQSLMQISG